MSNALPALHEGHAPITLQQLFREALDAFVEWNTETTEPLVTFEGRIYPISDAFEAMRCFQHHVGQGGYRLRGNRNRLALDPRAVGGRQCNRAAHQDGQYDPARHMLISKHTDGWDFPAMEPWTPARYG